MDGPVAATIPKVLHHVWVGPRPMPDGERRLVEGWSRVMPDWEVRGWDESNLDMSSAYVRQAYAVGAWNRVSDYARGMVLARHGGVYLDTDVELLRPLDELCGHGAFLGFQYHEADARPGGEWVNGAVLGAAPGHWIPTAMMERLGRIPGYRDTFAYSGPGLLTELLRERGLERVTAAPQEVGDVLVLPAEYFYPYPWDGEFRPDLVTGRTMAVHRWSLSWVSGRQGAPARPPLRKRLWSRAARHAAPVAFRARRWLNARSRGASSPGPAR